MGKHNKSLRYNNFDFLRIVLAAFVVFTHSYPLLGIEEKNEWLYKQSNGLTSFSNLGVGGFFAISGFLVYQSFMRSANFQEFFTKRVLRIYPGLLINLIIASLIVGRIVSDVSNYYLRLDVYAYTLKNLSMVNMQYEIADVFNNNPYPDSLNGSLWTIQYEVIFYLSFAILFIRKNVIAKYSWLMFPMLILLAYVAGKYPQAGYFIPYTTVLCIQLVKLGIWFILGVMMAIYKDYWIKRKKLVLIMSLIALIFLYLKLLPHALLPFVWTGFVITFGSLRTPYLSSIHRFGDPSYGMYIYGFLIQQVIVYYITLSFQWYFIMSLVISLLVGYISWHLIEKRALSLKLRRYFRKNKNIVSPTQV